MAKRKKSNKKPGKGGRIALLLFTALLLTLGAAIGIGALNADIVRIRRAEIVLPDLPRGFDGTTILYASDIDLCGLNTARKAAALMDSLQALRPDILILGGDYTSESVFDALNRGENRDAAAAKRLRERTDFFHYISAFSAPLGKFAIAAPEDAEPDALRQLMAEAGIRPLFNARADIRVGDDVLSVVGVSGEGANLTAIGGGFRRGDCALAVVWSPEAFPPLVTSEAADGGRWADLLLTGHTHGGQIRLFGRSVLALDRLEQQYLDGWRIENGLPIVVSTGVGCEGANLRLGTRAEVWLITLRRAEE